MSHKYGQDRHVGVSFKSSFLFFSCFFLWFGDPDLRLSPKASTAGLQIIVSEAFAQALLVWKVLILSFHNQRM